MISTDLIISHPQEKDAPDHRKWEPCAICDARQNKYAEEQREHYKQAVADFPMAEAPVDDLPFLWRFKEPFDPMAQNFNREWRQGQISKQGPHYRDHLGNLYVYISEQNTVPGALINVRDIEWRYSEDLLTKFVKTSA